MLLTRRKQRSKTLLQDVGRAASRIADESRSAAGTARSELGGLGTEIRDQASDALTQARLATAAKLAGAAQTVQPEGKKRGRWRFLIPAVVFGVIAAKVAKMRRERTDTASDTDVAVSPSDTEVAASTSTSSKATSSPSESAVRDDTNGKSRAKQTTGRSTGTGS